MSRRCRPFCRPLASVLAVAILAVQGFPLQARADSAPAASTGSAAPSGSDALLKRVNVEQKLNQQIPLDLAFRDETGATVKLSAYFGKKPVILAMVYYQCPMLCTLVLKGLVKSLRVVPFEAGKDFDIVVVSINPRETPQLAAQKKHSLLETFHNGSPDGWHFLTGKEPQIKRLADAIGFGYAYDAKRDQYAHAAFITVTTPAGRLSRYLFGIAYPPKDLRLALVEASNGRVGSLVDQLLLLCYHYDPSTGQYTVMTLDLMRAGGAVTLLVLGGWILNRLRKERRA